VNRKLRTSIMDSPQLARGLGQSTSPYNRFSVLWTFNPACVFVHNMTTT